MSQDKKSSLNNRLLKRFVYHLRMVDIDEDSSQFEEEQDLSDLSLFSDHVDELKIAGEQHPFAQLNLASLALSGDPRLILLHIRRSGSDMAGHMTKRGNMFEYPSNSNSEDEDENANNEDLDDGTMQMSEIDKLDMELPEILRSFAFWAFGVDGIPSLQILAYGEFSYGSRFESESYMLCRQALTLPGDEAIPFRLIRESDLELAQFIRENMDCLAACPEEPIVVLPED
ncbi:MAG: hypothetical protein M1814_005519 [Vezdaea aestivalis]|nr:MAG: hypothetical protein M1814_005519 [Vezdaea aestivalis]